MATETETTLTLTQAQLDAQIAERLERDRKARGWSDDDAKALKSFRDADKNRQIEDAKKQQDFEKAQALRDQQHQEELGKEKTRGDQILGRYRSERIENELIGAASSAINPKQVAALLRDRITLDDDFRPAVLDAAGKPTTLTVGKLVAEFLTENKHFVRVDVGGQSNGTAGAGGASGGDRGGAGDGPLGQLATAQAELEKLQEKAAKTGSHQDNQSVLKKNTEVQALKAKAKAEGLLR